MNSKKVNWLYLSIILLDLAVIVFINLFYLKTNGAIEIGIVLNLLISQLSLMVPALLFAMASQSGLNEMLGYHKIKISSIFVVILFTYLMMPLITAINAISMLFVDNAVSAISADVLQTPFPIVLFFIGIFGPFCEEFVFRGMIYRGYKESGSVFRAIFFSSLLFGLMHLNFNQAAYAFVIGIMFSLLIEATGSLWASTIAHMVFNSWQVCTMFLMNKIMPESFLEQTQEEMTKEILLGAIGPYLIVAVIATALAVCVLVWLAKREGRIENISNIWTKRKEKQKRLVTMPLIIGIVLSLAYMIFQVIITSVLS